MPILSIKTTEIGESGVLPAQVRILTTDTEAAVLTAGYLNHAVQNGFSFPLPCLAEISTKASSTADYQVGWYQITHVGSNWSVVVAGNPGDVVLPTVANQLVHATNATGTLSTDAASVVNLGSITAGSSAVAGSLTSFAGTGSTEFLRMAAINNTGGNFSTTLSNTASVGQSQTISIPDAGAATANFIISASAGTQTIGTGSLALTLGNITAAAGNIAATLGSVAAGTTVTGGTGVIATTGNVTASAGNLVAGATGAAGTVTSFAGTGANEFLRLSAVNNSSGDFSVTVSNAAAVGQSQVISIPDVGAATGQFNVVTGALVSGNLMMASGTAGKLADSGISAVAQSTLAQVTMSAAEFNGMYAAPKLLVAAQGANTMIVVDSVQMVMTYVSANYANGGVVSVQYDSTVNGAGVHASSDEAAADFFAAASTVFKLNGGLVLAPFTTCANKGLYLSNLTGAFTTGDSTWIVKVLYHVISTIA